MPTLNTKLLLRLLALVILLGGGLAILRQVQASRVPDSLLWQANAAAERGNMDKAVFYMRQYLEFRPDDHDTAIRLADLMLEKAVSIRDVTHAHFLYERVLREAPHRSDVARKLVTLCIRMSRYADATTHTERLIREFPADGVLRAQLGECLAAQNRPAEARKSFEAAVQSAPDHIRAYELLSRLLVRHFNKPADASAVLDRLILANSGQAEAYLIRSRFLKAQDRAEECMRDLDRVFLLDPENGEALVMSAELLQARGDVRRARETLRDTIATYPRFAHGYRALSWLELLSGNQADARSTLERGVVAIPDHPELLTPLADLWVEQGELTLVEDAIRRLEVRKDSTSRVSYLRGRVLMKQGKWNEALATLESLRTEAVGLTGLAAQLNLLIASCHERRGDRDGQIEALKRALAVDRNHLAARVALANAHLNAGRIDDCLKEYQAASASPYAGMGLHLTYASLRISRARVQGLPEEWKSIGTQIASIREKNPLAVEPAVISADWLAAQGKFEEAIKLLREEAAKRPGDARLWSALSSMLLRSHGTLAAAEAVSEGQLAAGESLELRLAQARVWAEDFQPGQERLARLEALPMSAGDAEKSRLHSAFLDLYESNRDVGGAMRMLTALASTNTQDTKSRRSLYRLAIDANPFNKGQWRYDLMHWQAELRRIEGNSSQSVAIVEALRSMTAPADEKRWNEIKILAASVLVSNPDDADAHLLLGQTAEKLRDSVLAAKHFESAARLEPLAIRYQESRLGFYLRAGNEEASERTLKALEADPRFSPLRFRAIIEGAIHQGGPESLSKCLAWLQPHLKREPRSAVWAGKLLENHGKVIDAIALYSQANQTAPNFADAWSARLLASSRLGEAGVKETMASCEKALGRKAFFSLCAECGSTVRSSIPTWAPTVATPEDRRAYAEACISTCEARGRLEDAVPVLTAFAEDKSAKPEDVAWAKQSLAALMAAMGSPEQKRGALNCLPKGQAASIEEARQRLASLLVVFRAVGGDDRRVVVRDLIGLLAQIVRHESATSNDWFQLAQLHRVAGDRVATRTCLTELTKREPKNLYYLAVSVDDWLAENRLEEVRASIPKLEEGVSDLRVVGSAARFHTLSNDAASVLNLVERFVRVADAGTTDGATRQRQSAELLDQLARLAAFKGLSCASPLLDGACERYRASLRAFPDAITPMVALLAFHGKIDPAFEELERQKTRHSPMTRVTAGVAILRSGHATPRQFQAVQGWIEESMVANAGSLPLKLNLAELHALRRDFASAEAVYRELLETEPKNAVALNNLAWILAPRPEASDQAMKFADRAIELYGASGEMLDTRARILISAGEYDRAVADLTDAINLAGTPLRYFHLALAQLKQEKPDVAAKTFREAKRRGLDSKSIHPYDLPTFQILNEKAVQ